MLAAEIREQKQMALGLVVGTGKVSSHNAKGTLPRRRSCHLYSLSLPHLRHLLPTEPGTRGGAALCGDEKAEPALSPGQAGGDTLPMCERGFTREHEGANVTPQGHAGHSPGDRARRGCGI